MAKNISRPFASALALPSMFFRGGGRDRSAGLFHARRAKLICLLAVLIFVAPLTAAAQIQFGTVYIFRGRDTVDYPKEMNALNPEAVIYLEGEKFLSMPELTFVGFQIPVGQYEIGFKKKGTRRPLVVEAGRTYYLNVEQTVYPYDHQIIYDVEDDKTAFDFLRRCDALGEKKIKIKDYEVIRVNPAKKKKS